MSLLGQQVGDLGKSVSDGTSVPPERVAVPTLSTTARWWLLALMGLAHITLFMVYFGFGFILLPQRLDLIDPASKLANLAVAGGIAALIAAVGKPLFGGLSDRAAGKMGQRAPWLVGGAVVAFAAILLMAHARTITEVIIWWCVIQGALAAHFAALTAIIPDRVEPAARGIFSAAAGLGPAAGGLFGPMVIASFGEDLSGAYAVLGIGPVICALLLAFTTRDTIGQVRVLGSGSRSEGLRRYLQAYDFMWLFAGRVCMMLGVALVQGYYYYILQDYIAPPGGTSPAEGVAQLMALTSIGMIVATLGGGWLSDRLGKRKIFVFVSSFVFVLGVILPFLMPSWEALLALAAIFGIGVGIYWAVDNAMVTLVLPSTDRHAQDMGIMGLANTVPQSVAPIIGAAAIAAFGYSSLFALAAVLSIACALAVLPIRRVP